MTAPRALAFLSERSTPDGERVLLLVGPHASLTSRYARLRERHVGIVAESEPMLLACEVM